MFFIIGFIVVFASVIGGYMGAGGHIDVLWQPLEFLIIFGPASAPLSSPIPRP